MYFSAQSVTNKLDELKAISQKHKPDIIAISESWLYGEKVDDTVLDLPNYQAPFRSDRQKRTGGGVCIWPALNLGDCSRFDFGLLLSQIELIGIKTSNLLIACIYIPPSLLQHEYADIHEFLLEKFDAHVLDTNKSVVLAGDFNKEFTDRYLDSLASHLNLIKTVI